MNLSSTPQREEFCRAGCRVKKGGSFIQGEGEEGWGDLTPNPVCLRKCNKWIDSLHPAVAV